MRVVSHQGDTLDFVCHRHLRRTDLVVAVLEANPGLAALGPVLPQGTAIVLPDAVPAVAAAPLLQLWD